MTYELSAHTAQQLRQILEGDPLPPDDGAGVRQMSSLEALYREQAPRLLRFFLRRSGQHDAGDLVQEAFLRFARAQNDRQEAVRQPEAYLSQVATNLLRNRARAAFHRTIAVPQEALEAVADPTDLGATLETRDTLNRMRAAMTKLSPRTREIFLSHRLDGATYAEIADRLGLSIKGVEWHMTKALRHLHKVLGRRQ